MTRTLLIVRPQPGAGSTAALARARGWETVVAPLFVVRSLAWVVPEPARFDALLLTSANALRHGGAGLRELTDIPAYAVGDATAHFAREQGFKSVIEGGGDVARTASRLRDDGRSKVLHLAGRDVRNFDETGLSVTHIPIYVSEEVAPDDFEATARTAKVVLAHSPRAGSALARQAGASKAALGLAAISEATLSAAGKGWRACAVATSPTDAALLDVAESL